MRIAFFLIIFGLSDIVSYAQKDSTKITIKTPKYYFNTTVLFDYYTKPEVTLDTLSRAGKKLKSYYIQQSLLAFSVPFYTTEKRHTDSTISNFTTFFTGTFFSFRPNFGGIADNHVLTKNGLGVRFIYNNGKKLIFFADISPFITKDRGYDETQIFRMASTFLVSYSISEKLNFRFGLTKSFLLGNRYYLPFVGFRVGAINKINLSVQFPRIVSLNIPIGKKIQISAYTKPQGGLFTISNKDTLYAKFLNNNKILYLGRYEFLTGLRIDFKPLKWLSLYASAGQTTKNFLALYSLHFNQDRKFEYGYFYRHFPDNSFFLNFGVTCFFGKTKSYYNMNQMYESINLNNTIGVGDNNTQIYQPTPDANPKKIKKYKADNKEVADLINSFDY